MGDHPYYSQIEAERVGLFAKLKAEQEKRAAFLQCLVTPASVPDGSSLASFETGRKPGDESEDWAALGISTDVAGGVRCQYDVDRYDGPSGSGFILGCCVLYQGKRWHYREHHGSESRGGVFGKWCEDHGEGV